VTEGPAASANEPRLGLRSGGAQDGISSSCAPPAKKAGWPVFGSGHLAR
jgi:hypothetical protein